MADDELPGHPAVPSVTKAPLESAAALRDPAAVSSLPPVTGGAAGALDASAGRIRREQLRQLVRSKAFLIGAALLLLGRDVFSRVITGATSILIIAPLATLLGTVAGTSIGLVQGYFRGAIDNMIGRIVDAVLALPVVIVTFLFVVALQPSKLTLILIIGFVFGVLIARTVRTAVLQERELDYIAAARLRDESGAHVMFVEILPNVLGPIFVEFTVRLGYAIFTIATLSFLGFGVQPPTPDWGADIANSYQYLAAGYWWETLFPALAIASLVIGVNLVADSIEAVVIQ